MVISSSVNDEMVPDVEVVLTAALPACQVPKSESGSTPLEPVGASAIHSALELSQSEHVCVVEKLSASACLRPPGHRCRGTSPTT